MKREAALALLVMVSTVLAAPVLGAEGPTADRAVAFGVSQPLSSSSFCDETMALPDVLGPSAEVPLRVPDFLKGRAGVATEPGTVTGPIIDKQAPAADLSFEGYGSDDNADLIGFRLAPPDTEGDVGVQHYVQWNNLGLKIFDKDGNFLKRCAGNVFWADSTMAINFPDSPCVSDNSGDPVVLYDHLAGRWVASQFTTSGFPEGHQCVAVSRTSNPLGAWTGWDFKVADDRFNDYPKMGVWPDGYYMTSNDFPNTANCPLGFCGVAITVLDRTAMLNAMDFPKMVQFFITFTGEAPAAFSLLPGHFEGYTLPPSGTCNYVIQAFDEDTWGDASGDPDGYRFWEICVNWGNPLSSTCEELPFVETPKPFDSELCGFSRDCIDQPDPVQKLDTLGQFTMHQFQIRNFSSPADEGAGAGPQPARLAEGSVPAGFTVIRGFSTAGPPVGVTGSLSHTVDTGGDVAGVHWAIFDLNDAGSAPIHDNGPVPPGYTVIRGGTGGIFVRDTATFGGFDSESRWMPSMTLNQDGDAAIVYSKSSSSFFPSVYYTAREAEDPPMSMQEEAVCVDGSGSQQGVNRWGDYAAAGADPVDDCTFWVTNEYVETTGSFFWNTQVCSFKFAGCGNFVLEEPDPGLAGQTNDLDFTGSFSGPVRLYGGTQQGTTTLGGQCAGHLVGISGASVLAAVGAPGGSGTFSVTVPGNLSGNTVFFQAIDQACNKSNIVVFQFP